MTSIIVSIYNSEQTLYSMIESVLNQTYQNFELILINDGSVDNSLKIIKNFMKKDERIVLIDKENSGLTKSLNIGLLKAKGEYIARLDADDVWFPTKLEKQIKLLKNDINCILVGTAYNEIDYNGQIIYENQRTPLILEYKDILEYIIRFNPFLHSSVVFKRLVLDTVGLYNEEFKYTQDYEYWIRIMCKYKVVNLEEILVSRRYSENMISVSKEKEQRLYGIKSKLLAIKLLNKSIKEYKYLINDILVYLLPKKIITFIRKIK